MKNSVIINIIFFLPVFSISQNSKITIRKNTCCDSLTVTLGVIRHSDTISYNSLWNKHALGVSFKNCNDNVSATIVSFEITINKAKSEFVKGNMYDFKKSVELKSGGKIMIKNCIVDCKNSLKESKRITLPERSIIIKPSE